MLIRSRNRLACAATLAALGAVAACSSGSPSSPSSSPSSPTPAGGSIAALARPTWATPERFAGESPKGETLPIQVHLQLRNADEAAAELEAISNPDHPHYGKFLSDAEFDARFGPTDDDVAAVSAHLRANGLEVTHVPGNRAYVAARGTASQIERAFATRLGLYKVGEEMRRAPIDAPSVPQAIAPRVAGVLGLSSSLQMKPKGIHPGAIRRDSLRRPNALNGPNFCSEWFGQQPDTFDPPYGPEYPPLTLAPCGYKPAQIRQAYGFDKSIRAGDDGTGVKVAVVDAYLSPTLLQDAQTYAAQNDPDYPLASSQLQTFQAPGTPTPPDPGWYLEQTLDVEAAHAIAPGATIVAVAAQSQSDQDLIAGLNLIISQHLATIVSNSYETQSEAGLTDVVIWKAIATQAGLKGVGLYFSSGDSGDESFGGFGTPTISFPGSLPTITSVGGTSLALGQTGQRLWETGWETGESFLNFQPPPPPPPVDGGDDGGFDGGDDASGDDGGGPIPFDAGPPPIVDSGTGASRALLLGRHDVMDGLDAGPSGFFWSPAPPGFFAFGGGGGVSILFEQPSYQKGIVPPALANQPGVPARVVPDVSMLGDPVTGFLIGTASQGGGYQELAIGGTSLSSPLFAGVMALAQQHAKRTFGFANGLLYKASKKGAFDDVLPLSSPQAVSPYPGIVTTFDYENQSIHTTAGYDDVTGLGVPDGAKFFQSVK